MLYSGVDLIRSSGNYQERLDRLKTGDDSVRPVGAAEKPQTSTEEDTQGALLRFARFVNKEGERKREKKALPALKAATNGPAPSGDPYRAAEFHRANLFERGQQLDVYI